MVIGFRFYPEGNDQYNSLEMGFVLNLIGIGIGFGDKSWDLWIGYSGGVVPHEVQKYSDRLSLT